MLDTELADGHLQIAADLVSTDEPSQAAIRRSLSACYYSVFHALARACANALVGSDPETRPNKAWVEVYRGLSHRHCRTSCKNASKVNFPDAILKFADSFEQMQELRERADYDPHTQFNKFSALTQIETARLSIESLRSATTVDKRAFAAWVLISSQGAKNARQTTANS